MQASQQPPTLMNPPKDVSLSKDESAVRLFRQWHRGGFWFGPLWAIMCGLLAAAQFDWSARDVLLVLLALLIAAGLWTIFWAALAETAWALPLGRWRDWQDGIPVRPLPYTQPGSPAAYMAVRLGHLRDWATRDLIPNYGSALLSCVIAPVVSLILAAVLGSPALLVGVVAVLLPQVALVLCRGNGQPSPLLYSIMAISLPMLLGYALYKAFNLDLVVVAVGFGLSFAALANDGWNTRLWNLGQAVVFLLLIATRHPVGAFLLVVLWLPQFLLQTYNPDLVQPAPTASARRAQWWLMASMLVTVLALA
jgi:hypothetical protein